MLSVYAASPLFSALSLLVGYGLGSIPFGLIITQCAGTTDIRTIGSGNIGATNVLRTGRKLLAVATLVLDALKGALAVIIVERTLGVDFALLAACGAFLGHLFPIWLGFKGGKGVSTYIGLLLALVWPAALIFCAVWLLTACVSRYSSLAALLASVAAPIYVWIVGPAPYAVLFTALSVILWIMHRSNITRLASGEETRIGKR
jgi:glycerol-3-phosphate acyltransferase PlsY